jgi:hypothetical protein
MDIKKFWDEAVTYNEYLRHAGEIWEIQKSTRY